MQPDAPSVETRLTTTLPMLDIRADVQSVDEGDRVVTLTFSTGAKVKRYDWSNGEWYLEELSLEPGHVRLDRLNTGAPLLNSHFGGSLDAVLGTVVRGSATVNGKRGDARVRFSRRADVEPYFQDVRDGILSKVSVGYVVHAYEERAPKGNGLKVRRAIDWEPYEVSLVAMPADNGAEVRDGKLVTPRGEQLTLYPCQITVRADEESAPVAEEQSMRETSEKQSETLLEQNPLDPGAPMLERQETAPAAPAQPNDVDRGVDQENERVLGIIEGCRAARLPDEFMRKLIADKVPLVEARGKILEEIGRRSGNDLGPKAPGAPTVQFGDDPFVHARKGIENALAHRIAPTYFPLDDNGRRYRGMTLTEIAKVYLQSRGVRTTEMSKLEVAGLALGLNYRNGYHTTSDFALLLADVAGKTLRRAYEQTPATFLPIARRVTLPDFKPVKRLQLGEAPELKAIDQHGEYTRGTIGEGKEEMQLVTYGRIFGITRRAIVNDDVDAFSRVPMLFGRSARNLESNIVWEQITSNPTMGDGKSLFHTDHGNLQTDGDAPSVASLARARAAMRLQKGLDGKTPLNLQPRYIIVPPSLETEAEKLVGPIVPGRASDANPFTGKLEVIAEPRLEANSSIAWYIASSPDQVDILEYAYLEGEEGPVIENRVGFDVDGLEIKCRLDFGAKAIDWRGLHKDPGEQPS